MKGHFLITFGIGHIICSLSTCHCVGLMLAMWIGGQSLTFGVTIKSNKFYCWIRSELCVFQTCMIIKFVPCILSSYICIFTLLQLKVNKSNFAHVVVHSSNVNCQFFFTSDFFSFSKWCVLDKYNDNGFGFVCSNMGFWCFIPINVYVEIMFDFNSCDFPLQIIICSFHSWMT